MYYNNFQAIPQYKMYSTQQEDCQKNCAKYNHNCYLYMALIWLINLFYSILFYSYNGERSNIVLLLTGI